MLDHGLRERLKSNSLFHHIDLDEIGHLLENCVRCTLTPGDTLLDPDKENHNLYVILSGELRVYLGGRDLPAHTMLGAGECAGEMSLIDGRGVSALVIAASLTELLVIPHAVLWALTDRSHGICRNLLAILSGRMRRDNLALVTTASRSLEFEQAASVDALTGLHNRRWLGDAFPRAIRRCEQDAAPLCFVMADVDHFKRLNDACGHLTGDIVLRAIAHRLAESLRSQDLIARYGGEEFALVLPQTSTEEGLRIAERLRAAIEQMSLKEITGGAVATATISFGVAPLTLEATLDSLIAAADAALYRAKNTGRNRVEVSAAG